MLATERYETTTLTFNVTLTMRIQYVGYAFICEDNWIAHTESELANGQISTVAKQDWMTFLTQEMTRLGLLEFEQELWQSLGTWMKLEGSNLKLTSDHVTESHRWLFLKRNLTKNFESWLSNAPWQSSEGRLLCPGAEAPPSGYHNVLQHGAGSGHSTRESQNINVCFCFLYDFTIGKHFFL